MNRPSRISLALSFALATAGCQPQGSTPAADATAGNNAPPAKLGLCASCHGVNGRSSIPGYPHLAGQDATYMRVQLQAYRDGRREHAQMQAIAGVLSEADIEQLSAWYAMQPADGGR